MRIVQGVAESRLRVVDEGDMETMGCIANEPRLIALRAPSLRPGGHYAQVLQPALCRENFANEFLYSGGRKTVLRYGVRQLLGDRHYGATGRCDPVLPEGVRPCGTPRAQFSDDRNVAIVALSGSL